MQLGSLEQVDLRDIWKHEAKDFTPWLAKEENLSMLGNSIGIELELEAQEKSVGPFSADLLCKDTGTDSWVVIENQLEKTNHTHLGQLLTYSSGLKAVTVVWVAKKFTDEHRATLDWLNEITSEKYNFFGLEVELWRIGNSNIAPKFNIVSKPNDWSKTIISRTSSDSTSELTESKLLQRDFWSEFLVYTEEKNSFIKTTKALPQHWMNIAIGKSGTKLNAIASFWNSETESSDTHEIRVDLVLTDKFSKIYFDNFHSEKEIIEQELGMQLIWHSLENTKTCRIYIRKETNLKNRAGWPKQHAWLLENLEKFYKVFSARVKGIDVKSDSL